MTQFTDSLSHLVQFRLISKSGSIHRNNSKTPVRSNGKQRQVTRIKEDENQSHCHVDRQLVSFARLCRKRPLPDHRKLSRDKRPSTVHECSGNPTLLNPGHNQYNFIETSFLFNPLNTSKNEKGLQRCLWPFSLAGREFGIICRSVFLSGKPNKTAYV